MSSKKSSFSVESTIKFTFQNPKFTEFAYNTFLPELKQSKTWRSTIEMNENNNQLEFYIKSSDITAFRAAVSDIISLGKIVESTINMCK
ncbi:MAG: KEOPS complex subunit Pcc1 [Promethearchaeota archaeon]